MNSNALRLCRKSSFVFMMLMPFGIGAFPMNINWFGESLPGAKLPISLAEQGAVFVVDLDAKANAYTYSFYLRFLVGADKQEQQRVSTILGLKERGNGSTYKDDHGELCYVRTGISIPLRLTISRVGENDETIMYVRDFDKLWGYGGNNSNLPRAIDFVRLEPAHYKIRLEVLAAVNELSGVPVNFIVDVPGK